MNFTQPSLVIQLYDFVLSNISIKKFKQQKMKYVYFFASPHLTAEEIETETEKITN